MNRFNLSDEQIRNLMTKKRRKSGLYKCKHCNCYFDSHINITQHLFDEFAFRDNRYKKDKMEVSQ
jgi:hypothetical protein